MLQQLFRHTSIKICQRRANMQSHEARKAKPRQQKSADICQSIVINPTINSSFDRNDYNCKKYYQQNVTKITSIHIFNKIHPLWLDCRSTAIERN